MDHKSFRLSPVNFFKAYRDKHLQIGCGVFAGVFLLSLILISAIVRTESWGGLLFGAFALACVLSATFYFSQSSFSKNPVLRYEARERLGYVIVCIAAFWCIGVADQKGVLRATRPLTTSVNPTDEQQKQSRAEWIELQEAATRLHWALIGGAFVFLAGARVVRHSAFKRGELAYLANEKEHDSMMD